VESDFHTGSEKEIDDALAQLIQLCQSKGLLQSDTQKAESLLLAFLEKMLPAEALISSIDDAHEIDQLVANTFKKVLFLECEKFASSQQQNSDYTFNPNSITENQELHRLEKIFHYLQDKVAHLADQLFDEACFLVSKNKVVAAQIIFHILLNSEIKDDVDRMLSYLSEDITYSLYLLPPQNEFRPKCAVLRATFENNYQPFKLLLALIELVLENSNEFALEEASKSEDPEVLELLSEIYGDGDFKNREYTRSEEESILITLRALQGDGRFTDLKNKDLAASFKAQARNCEVLRSVRYQQEEMFGIPYGDSIESRLQTGKNRLSEGAMAGVEILLSLKELDHPTAKEAGEIVTSWLAKTENRVLLMQGYGSFVLVVSKELETNNYKFYEVMTWKTVQEEYEKKFKDQLIILLQLAQKFSEQGNKEAAKQLVHQLLEREIEIELKNDLHPLNSTFYQLLIACPALDQTDQNEVQRRLDVIEGEKLDSSLRECVDFNAPKRPWANLELGLILKEDTSGLLLKKKEARDHFQRALSEGNLLAKSELEGLENVMSSFSSSDILNEADTFLKKHKARYFFDKDQSDLKHALSCYQWVADEFDEIGAHLTYLKYLPEMSDVNAKTFLQAGKKVLDHFSSLIDYEVRRYIAVLDKATKSIDVEVAAEAYFVLAKLYEEQASSSLENTVSTEPKLFVEKVENAAKHYQRAVELGNKKAVEEEVFFLAKQICISSGHPLKENSTIILRLKAIVGSGNKGADKESVKQAALALATYYSSFTEVNVVAQGEKYEDIAHRLNYDVEVEQVKKALSSSSTNKPSLREAETKNHLHLAVIKHDLAEMYLNATGGEQDALKATELFIEAADLGHRPSKEMLVSLAKVLMNLNLYTSPQLEALYRLSQVMDTLLSETQLPYISSDELMEQAAKMGHPEAKILFALKAEWNNKPINEEQTHQAKLIEEHNLS